MNKNLPEFIVGGTAKSGTHSIRHILSQHPNVYIPDRPLFFFGIDDFEENSDFFIHPEKEWVCHDFEKHYDEYLSWYKSFFEEAGDRIPGEVSGTYLPSEKAPARIAKLLPDVKLIFSLRDPVERTYSHYWYALRTGRAVYNFEDTIRYKPGAVMKRSYYKRQIERYLNYFSEEQIHIVIFEEFVNNTQQEIDKICNFIGVSADLDLEEIDTHKNPARLPENILLQRFYNWLFPYDRRKWSFLPIPFVQEKNKNRWFRYIHPIYRKMNPLREREKPAMNPKTRRFLEKFMAMENRGLSNLIGIDVSKYWEYMKENH